MWVDDSQSPPEWVKTEQQQFREARDKNKDGYLDREEIYAWLFPADYDHIESELKHLMSETDDDQVLVLFYIQTYSMSALLIFHFGKLETAA